MMRVFSRKMILSTLGVVFFVGGCTLSPAATRGVNPSDTPAPSKIVRPTSSVLPTETITPSPTAEVCENSRSSIVEEKIPSKLLGEDLHYRVYLPPCYTTHPEKPYPVLYLLHGQQQDASLWEKLGALEAVDSLIQSGASQPFLIVMPTERHFLLELPDTKYGQAISEELVPAIDAQYPTCTAAACRAIGGISRGGAWAVRIGFSHPELFHFIGAHSPAVFYSDLNRLPTILRDFPPSETPVTYIDTGNLDNYRKTAVKLESILTGAGAAHEWHANEGMHNLDYWRAHIAEYMAWYAQNWQ